MRYRLMASYGGSPFEVGVGPTDDDIVLFAACPPPEDLGFEPATGHWRKQLRLTDVQAVWESRPVGLFRGERCMVLDDLGDHLHIGYLGHDGYQAERLGYWQVDRGVFELIAPRAEVTEIVEEQADYTRAIAKGGGSDSAGGIDPAGYAPVPPGYRLLEDTGSIALPVTSEPPLPVEAEALRAASARRPPQPAPLAPPVPQPPIAQPPVPQPPVPQPPVPQPILPRPTLALPAQPEPDPVLPDPVLPDPVLPGPLHPAPVPPQLLPLPPTPTGLPRLPKPGKKQLATEQLFAELADLAGIPADSYSIGEEVDGALCVVEAEGGFEVFHAANGARHEVQVFATEESACFYVFGVLAAEAVRTGALTRPPAAIAAAAAAALLAAPASR